MGKELKVLMMGGARVGKSSALAAIMNYFITGKVRNILTATDKTKLVKKDGVKQVSIESKLQDVKTMLTHYNGKIILVNDGQTEAYFNYRLELSVPGSGNTMSILFTDINGEFFEGGNIEQTNIINLIKDYDVFIVAIDTPFMMESRKDELVDSIINNKYNCIESIHTFLTQINDDDGKDAKLVIFTPIKCEKWAHEGKLDLVSEYVQEDYKTSISALKRFKNIQIEILPIQTIGSVVFEEHREALLFIQKKRTLLFFEKEEISKCALLSRYKVRLSDGTEVNVKEGRLIPDAKAVMIYGTDIIRPNSWYKVKSSEYRPHNCGQLAFHILDFMLSKVIDVKVRESENENILIVGIRGITNFALNVCTLGIWNKLKDIFGSISVEKMTSIINKINQSNMIKREGEGIVMLKKCNFKIS